MSADNGIIVSALKDVAASIQFSAVGGQYFYRRHQEVICLVNLQRSSWGPQHYLNAGVFFTRFGDTRQPKEHKCHIRWRLDSVMGQEGGRILTEALDLESNMDDSSRIEFVGKTAREYGFGVLTDCVTEKSALQIGRRINAAILKAVLPEEENDNVIAH